MSYNIFSEFYDELTFNVDYKQRAQYLKDIQTRLGRDFGLSLDLACGTGKLTIELKKMGVDVFGLDSSVDMLSIAMNNAMDNDMHILFINQSMQELELYSSIDTCICNLDSINHMIDENDVKKTFDNVYKDLEKDGVFIFDVNTIYKHKEVLANNTFTYDVDDVFLTWRNTLKDNNVVDIDLEFSFVEDDKEVKEFEHFSERAYDIEDLKSWLKKSGFKDIMIYSDLTFDKPNDNDEKLTFVAIK